MRLSDAESDYENALHRSAWRRIASWFRGGPNQLMPFDDVRARLPFRGQRHLGLRAVPIDSIVGSVGRYRDFDRAFLPTQRDTRDRWLSVRRARDENVALPAVDLYKIGDVYFVRDGNHRVSVARTRGQAMIDAHVTEIDVPVPLAPDSDLDALVIAQERQGFFETTGIAMLRPDALDALEATVEGQYPKLLDHISAHRWYLGERRDADVPEDDAVADWYDHVYRPVIDKLAQHGLLDAFDGCGPADLYLWITKYQDYLRDAYEASGALDDGERAQDDGDEAPLTSDEDTSAVVTQTVRARLESEEDAVPLRRLLRLLARNDWVGDAYFEQAYARFRETIQLQRVRPEADLRTTLPRGYDRLREHISGHRWYLGEQRDAEVSFEEAVASWYDRVYRPLVDLLRDHGLIARMPERTEADLYLWTHGRKRQIAAQQGHDVDTAELVYDLAAEQRAKTPVRNMLRRLRRKKPTAPDDDPTTPDDDPTATRADGASGANDDGAG
ncbi:MAG: hypothetical protein AAF772_00500 [Acidobacteriota bacterium]